jgi:hypothetical protein
MLAKHGSEYHRKCQEEGVALRDPGDIDLDDSDTEFSLHGLVQRLAEWIAIDDQASSQYTNLCSSFSTNAIEFI